jgi:NitT/TauT family transport system ATP-binding protein
LLRFNGHFLLSAAASWRVSYRKTQTPATCRRVASATDFAPTLSDFVAGLAEVSLANPGPRESGGPAQTRTKQLRFWLPKLIPCAVPAKAFASPAENIFLHPPPCWDVHSNPAHPFGIQPTVAVTHSPAMTAQHKGHIAVEGLRFLHGATTILNELTFDISPGEHVAIVGRSGVGKSTLLHLLAGLAKPSAGEIRIDGNPLAKSTQKPVLMFQRPALLPWLNVVENILVPLKFSGLLRRAPNVAHAKAHRLVEQIGLGERADALPSGLSGGQQQRVALARALAGEPAVLLLDEPFSALDSETRTALRKDIRNLATAHGTTLITVTHDLSDAAALANRVLALGGAPAGIEDDFSLGGIEAEQRLRRRLSHLRQAA